ncbi:uncharacterized protein TRAVEDRAFT_67814 [Trametes versicolor FP-101664 SS1]|uniref:uncharacterized protein n=1 Tax=Trametes versicolor (strain FP-101664) TaxID=717944 RepID=UPI000462410F|nr:uncharacterized protein TRAVEDRAFT_67814 [Trametes versicolor FP-101664 SS1]EIW63833.1 hypothetical protein TRAVEDRAFT_67814 [Trametes versicolor FP-101664 SS1]
MHVRQQKPYSDVKRKRTTKPRIKNEPPTALSKLSSPSIPTPPAPGIGTILFRKLCAEKIRTDYPGVEPRSDFDLVALGSRRFHGSPAEIYAQLDEQLASHVESDGYEFIMNSAKKLCDAYVEPTGIKPGQLGTGEKSVFIRPIPDSKYSIRLFPGSISAAEYCLDFVESATGKAVNSPFKFELWAIPNPDTPWLSFQICGQLRSIEHAHGIKQKDILPGAEKFILRDGQTCVLVRPGKRSIRFTVPVRKVKAPDVIDDVDVLDLPQFIDP